MSITVSDMLSAIGAYTDIDTDTPTGDDLTTRINYLNQAQLEWSGSYDWDTLRKTSFPTYTVSGTSIGLNAYFNKMKSPLVDVSNGFPIGDAYIFHGLNRPEDRFGSSASDKYTYILGDELLGKSLQTSPLKSGASLMYDWMAYPTALATLTDISACPRPEFLIKRGIAFVLESRSDPRFPQVKADAQQLLHNMVAEQDSNFGARVNQIRNRYEQAGYHIGE